MSCDGKLGKNSCSENKRIAVHSQTRTFLSQVVLLSFVQDCNDKLVKKQQNFDGMFSLPSPGELSAREKFSMLGKSENQEMCFDN